MTGVDGALVTAFLAVIAFVAGQALLRFVAEPIQEQKRLIGEIAHALLFYANRDPEGVNMGTFTAEHVHEGSHHLRDLAGRLRSSLFYVLFYDTLARLGFVPTKLTSTRSSRIGLLGAKSFTESTTSSGV